MVGVGERLLETEPQELVDRYAHPGQGRAASHMLVETLELLGRERRPLDQQVLPETLTDDHEVTAGLSAPPFP